MTVFLTYSFNNVTVINSHIAQPIIYWAMQYGVIVPTSLLV